MNAVGSARWASPPKKPSWPAAKAPCSSRRNRRGTAGSGRGLAGRSRAGKRPSVCLRAKDHHQARHSGHADGVAGSGPTYGGRQSPKLGAEVLGVGRDGGERLRRAAEQDGTTALFWKAISLAGAGKVKTTWKYGTGRSAACRSVGRCVRAAPWHFGQCRLQQEL